MEKILITFGTQPFAQRIGKILASRFICHYATSEPFPDLLLKQNYTKIPTGANPTFAHEMLKLCLDNDYRWLLPLGKSELQPLLESRVLLEEYGIALLLPETLDNCLVLQNPVKEMDVRVVFEGNDILDGTKKAGHYFSGVAVFSNEGDEPALCLI
ncbi:hypothetical protein [Sphingobacterium sp. LRF_L2]|uniref:hypothetical protein n=1 Tax=Sphingobacterium sp. LRF_L2 TaxID=3369421 RepID=UPI003F60347A